MRIAHGIEEGVEHVIDWLKEPAIEWQEATHEPASVGAMLVTQKTVKARKPGTFVFYRCGDFYEVIGEDAVFVAPIIDTVLTGRYVKTMEFGEQITLRIPMTGVNYQCIEEAVKRLVRMGYSVALCDPVPDPWLRPKEEQGVASAHRITTWEGGPPPPLEWPREKRLEAQRREKEAKR